MSKKTPTASMILYLMQIFSASRQTIQVYIATYPWDVSNISRYNAKFDIDTHNQIDRSSGNQQNLEDHVADRPISDRDI